MVEQEAPRVRRANHNECERVVDAVGPTFEDFKLQKFAEVPRARPLAPFKA